MESAYETLQVRVTCNQINYNCFLLFSNRQIVTEVLLKKSVGTVSNYEQDAAGLTQLSSTVEDVFASGDLPRVAETLANMRHCLSAVGEVICKDPPLHFAM